MTKKELQDLVAADRMPEAIDLATRIVDALPEAKALRPELVLLQSRWESLDKIERSDTVPADAIRQNRNQIKLALLELLQSFPEQLPDVAPAPTAAAAKGMTEETFKWRLFMLMIGVKVWLLCWIILHQGAGGFTSGEAQATIALLLAVFTSYISPMLADLLRRRHAPARDAATVRPGLRWLSWGAVLLYGLLLHNIIAAKAAGTLADNPAANYENMTKWIAVVESGLGLYVGLIVGAFFKEKS